MTEQAKAEARKHAQSALQQAGIVLTPQEADKIEVADLGLGEFEQTGLCLLTFLDTERVGGRELILLPRQTVPQHKHPPVGDDPGKEETFRCRWGEVYLYVEDDHVEGDPVDPATAKATLPKGREAYYTVWHEIVLRPGEQYTAPLNAWHWLQAGEKGAVVTEFSTKIRDAHDLFSDPDIRGR